MRIDPKTREVLFTPTNNTNRLPFLARAEINKRSTHSPNYRTKVKFLAATLILSKINAPKMKINGVQKRALEQIPWERTHAFKLPSATLRTICPSFLLGFQRKERRPRTREDSQRRDLALEQPTKEVEETSMQVLATSRSIFQVEAKWVPQNRNSACSSTERSNIISLDWLLWWGTTLLHSKGDPKIRLISEKTSRRPLFCNAINGVLKIDRIRYLQAIPTKWLKMKCKMPFWRYIKKLSNKLISQEVANLMIWRIKQSQIDP